jgi:hypothetical protein
MITPVTGRSDGKISTSLKLEPGYNRIGCSCARGVMLAMLSPKTRKVSFWIMLVAVLVISCALQFMSWTAAPAVADLAYTATASPPPIGSPAPTSTATVSFAPVQFLNTETGFLGGLEEVAATSGVDLGVSGIYALDKATAFLFGSMDVYGNTMFSIVLMTEDGGKHWTEVMPRIAGSSVLFVSFVEGGKGWALAMWTVEGPGAATLYHSTDYGRTWHKLSDVPKWAWYGVPIRMEFYDEKRGQIDIVYDVGLPSTNRIAFLTTSDGGLSWQETGSYSLSAETSEGVATAEAIYQQNHAADPDQSTGRDGSSWKVRAGGEFPYVTVLRKLTTESDWSAVSLIPRTFKYQDGKILEP